MTISRQGQAPALAPSAAAAAPAMPLTAPVRKRLVAVQAAHRVTAGFSGAAVRPRVAEHSSAAAARPRAAEHSSAAVVQPRALARFSEAARSSAAEPGALPRLREAQPATAERSSAAELDAAPVHAAPRGVVKLRVARVSLEPVARPRQAKAPPAAKQVRPAQSLRLAAADQRAKLARLQLLAAQVLEPGRAELVKPVARAKLAAAEPKRLEPPAMLARQALASNAGEGRASLLLQASTPIGTCTCERARSRSPCFASAPQLCSQRDVLC
jgi:hypothetical protein